jgi:NADP-dependent 3-hydroxy acid dehydrogenase YdfG
MNGSRLKDKVIVITGASAGIGRACATAFAAAGARLAIGARRIEALQEFAHTVREQYGVQIYAGKLDVCEAAQVEEFVAQTLQTFGRIDVLINNAGLALGLDKLFEGDERDWARMIDTNVMGALRMTRAVVRVMLEQPDGGHVINLGSIAGHVAYEGGGVYCATKHALRAITDALRLEVLGKPIRVGSIDPGMVETEFSGVRFRGDLGRAQTVYHGMTPLAPEDIAECAVFMASRPPHVCIDKILINPTDQAGLKVSRRE